MRYLLATLTLAACAAKPATQLSEASVGTAASGQARADAGTDAGTDAGKLDAGAGLIPRRSTLSDERLKEMDAVWDTWVALDGSGAIEKWLSFPPEDLEEWFLATDRYHRVNGLYEGRPINMSMAGTLGERDEAFSFGAVNVLAVSLEAEQPGSMILEIVTWSLGGLEEVFPRQPEEVEKRLRGLLRIATRENYLARRVGRTMAKLNLLTDADKRTLAQFDIDLTNYEDRPDFDYDPNAWKEGRPPQQPSRDAGMPMPTPRPPGDDS